MLHADDIFRMIAGGLTIFIGPLDFETDLAFSCFNIENEMFTAAHIEKMLKVVVNNTQGNLKTQGSGTKV